MFAIKLSVLPISAGHAAHFRVSVRAGVAVSAEWPDLKFGVRHLRTCIPIIYHVKCFLSSKITVHNVLCMAWKLEN